MKVALTHWLGGLESLRYILIGHGVGNEAQAGAWSLEPGGEC